MTNIKGTRPANTCRLHYYAIILLLCKLLCKHMQASGLGPTLNLHPLTLDPHTERQEGAMCPTSAVPCAGRRHPGEREHPGETFAAQPELHAPRQAPGVLLLNGREEMDLLWVDLLLGW